MAWSEAQNRAATDKGIQRGSLTKHERQMLEQAAKQAGERGAKAREALRNAK